MRALRGRTAERLTKAATANHIVVLESAVIAESGTHEDLVTESGTYACWRAAWSGARSREI
jgi:ATP-binding cassette subfamily C protein